MYDYIVKIPVLFSINLKNAMTEIMNLGAISPSIHYDKDEEHFDVKPMHGTVIYNNNMLVHFRLNRKFTATEISAISSVAMLNFPKDNFEYLSIRSHDKKNIVKRFNRDKVIPFFEFHDFDKEKMELRPRATRDSDIINFSKYL